MENAHPPKNIILFDFDGVIVDTFDMCLQIMRQANPSVTADEYKKRFEGNINYSQQDKAEKQQVAFFDKYREELQQLQPVPGITPVIEELARTYPLTIVSSTISNPIRAFLEHHDLLGHFTEILGSDVAESKVEKIQKAVFDHNASPTSAIFITDTVGDVHEAQHVGVHTIAVTWGFHSYESLLSAKPDTIARQPDDIPKAVASMLTA